MNRLVYSVFKAIMMAIIFVFVFDMAFYLYRAISLNSRMQSISTSLQKVVMENNYLPSETATMYQHLFGQLIVDFNGGSYSIGADGSLNLNDSDINNNFISGMHWNYKNGATGVSGMSETTRVYRYNGSTFTPTDIPLVIDKMCSPADYGQVMIVQLRVGVFQPLWGWGAANGKYEYNGEDGTKWVRNATGASTEFVYNYYVPCLQYKTTNQ
jgi:hypothetical protein